MNLILADADAMTDVGQVDIVEALRAPLEGNTHIGASDKEEPPEGGKRLTSAKAA